MTRLFFLCMTDSCLRGTNLHHEYVTRRGYNCWIAISHPLLLSLTSFPCRDDWFITWLFWNSWNNLCSTWSHVKNLFTTKILNWKSSHEESLNRLTHFLWTRYNRMLRWCFDVSCCLQGCLLFSDVTIDIRKGCVAICARCMFHMYNTVTSIVPPVPRVIWQMHPCKASPVIFVFAQIRFRSETMFQTMDSPTGRKWPPQ